MNHYSYTAQGAKKELRPRVKIDMGPILSTSPPIVESILKHLNAKDLCSCAQVCTLWHSMACTEKKRRKRVVWFCKVALTEYSTPPSHVTHNATSTISERFEWELRWELSRNMTEPAFCMAFASTQLIDNFSELFPSFTYGRSTKGGRARLLEGIRRRHYLTAVMENALKRHLPAHCPVAFAIAPGIVGCDVDRRPVEVESGLGLSGFFIPKAPGVEVHYFPVSHLNFKTCDMDNLLPAGTSVKCLLVFITSTGVSLSEKVVQSFLLKEKCQMALGGAIVERTESFSGSIIALTGDNVQAASVVIGPEDGKPETKAKLEKFRDSGLLRNRCFAFMFACVGRGHNHYREHNVECSIFHRLFPRVPLAGVFGNGEIGITYFPHLPSANRTLQIGRYKRPIKKYLHSYTTVFVMVAIRD